MARPRGDAAESGQRVFHVHRAELPLDESVLLKPDGAPAKFTTQIGPLLALGIDPLEDETWRVAFTDAGTRRGADRRGCSRSRCRLASHLRADLDRLARDATPASLSGGEGLYLIPPGWAERLEALRDEPGSGAT